MLTTTSPIASWRQTLHALAVPMLRGRVEPYIDRERRAINFPALLDQPWSDRERAMLGVACTLWGREDIADARLSPVLHVMDDDNLARVIEAILIRRGASPASWPLAVGTRP